ncbi:MAG: hypothetical protein ACM335_02025 [Deltaproteobacteria bacterium]
MVLTIREILKRGVVLHPSYLGLVKTGLTPAFTEIYSIFLFLIKA